MPRKSMETQKNINIVMEHEFGMYLDTKIDRYQPSFGGQDHSDLKDDFDLIDGFKNAVKPYIFDDISIRYNSNISMKEAFQARLQMLMSSALLRSLMLKEGLVVALNTSNFPSYHACLKSFFEVPALLGYVATQIEENDDCCKIIELMKPLSLGSGPAGSLKIGNIKSIGVRTMFEALDRIYKKIRIKNGANAASVEKDENMFHSLYGDVCNHGHINWNAHWSVGLLIDGVWSTNKITTKDYKHQFYPSYSAGFICGIKAISIMCDYIFRDSKVDHFSELNNPKYFCD